MDSVRGGSGLPFGWHDHPHGMGLVEKLQMAAERGGGRGRGPGGRGRPGPPGFGGGPPGFGGGPRGGPFGFAQGPKVRRGDVRTSVLALLAEEPRNGYQIIQEIDQRSGGVWRPSAGSVYPALQQLQDEGLVRSADTGGRRLFELTEEGTSYVDENIDSDAAPWEAVSDSADEQQMQLRSLTKELTMAAAQVAHAGNAAQVTEAHRIVKDARRALYRVLAEDDQDEAE